MDAFLRPANWPLVVVSLGMIACAVIDWWKFKVPNYLTFPLILSGWLLGLLHNFGVQPFGDAGVGGIGAALAGTFFAFGLFLPILAIGAVGQGDVKMTMGFGSWIGAFFGLQGWLCLWVILISWCAGLLIGGPIGLVMMAVRGEYRKNLDNLRVMFMDLVTVGSIGKIAERNAERKPGWHKLPYGIPLCLGFVGYLLLAAYWAPKAPAPEEQPSSLSAAAEPSICLIRTAGAPTRTAPRAAQNPQS
jgi:prepilin peptidase CpaA